MTALLAHPHPGTVNVDALASGLAIFAVVLVVSIGAGVVAHLAARGVRREYDRADR